MGRLTYLIAALCICSVANADVLIKRNGDEVTCSVVRITPSVIVYTLPGQSVEREIGLGDVFMAKYDNGSKEMFTGGPASSSTGGYAAGRTSCKYRDFFPVAACPEIATDYSGLPPASRKYEMWDIYDENGLRGVVVDVSADGRHGKIVSLRTVNYVMQSSFSKLPHELAFGCDDFFDGEYNTNMIRQTCADAGLTGNRYPKLLKLLDNMGPGWYIPSYGELVKLIYDFQLADGETGLKMCKAAMKRLGGETIDKYDRLTSSSECRQENSSKMGFCNIYIHKDTYSDHIDTPEALFGGQRVHGDYRAFHKF